MEKMIELVFVGFLLLQKNSDYIQNSEQNIFISFNKMRDK